LKHILEKDFKKLIDNYTVYITNLPNIDKLKDTK